MRICKPQVPKWILLSVDWSLSLRMLTRWLSSGVLCMGVKLPDDTSATTCANEWGSYIGFDSWKADPDLWYHLSKCANGEEYYEYVLLYVADCLVTSDQSESLLQKELGQHFVLLMLELSQMAIQSVPVRHPCCIPNTRVISQLPMHNYTLVAPIRV